MNNYKFFIATGIISSIIVIVIAVTLASQRLSYFSSASQNMTSEYISRENSYIFASPISAIADGISIIRITVFLVNNQGLGVPGQKVQINSSGPVVIGQISPVTDNFGRAIFDITSTNPGNYTISAGISGVILPQSVSVVFR